MSALLNFQQKYTFYVHIFTKETLLLQLFYTYLCNWFDKRLLLNLLITKA